LGESQDLLSTRDTNYHRRNVFHIDERFEIFRASKIGKMTMLSVACAILPPIFSSDLKCSSTLLPALP
jgi:hypothetical protein